MHWSRTTEITPDWVDEIAVERFCTDRAVGRSLTWAERFAAARKMISQGVALSTAADRTALRIADVEGYVQTGCVPPKRETRHARMKQRTDHTAQRHVPGEAVG